MDDKAERFLCLASRLCGQEFLRQCAEMGVRPTLLTLDSQANAPWPRIALEQLLTMPAGLNREQIRNTVTWLARERRFDRILALDDADLETAAELREHLRIPGMGTTTTAYYRDRLAMRISARESGYLVPEFCRVFHYDELRSFLQQHPAPWQLTPRLDSPANQSYRIHSADHLWQTLDQLGDRQSHFLLEEILPGDLFQVDSILSEAEVCSSVIHQCDRLPSPHAAGVVTCRTVDRGSHNWFELTALNAGLAPSLGMVRGITHAEFLRSRDDGRFYFQQIAARVGEALHDAPLFDLVEASTGINLWREWARLEIASLRHQSYIPPTAFESYVGSVLCLAPHSAPETANLQAPEIVQRLQAEHRAGLVVSSQLPERIAQLLADYSDELARRYLPPNALL